MLFMILTVQQLVLQLHHLVHDMPAIYTCRSRHEPPSISGNVFNLVQLYCIAHREKKFTHTETSLTLLKNTGVSLEFNG
jgi:hypothetical protein